jgi:hypothetical protein
MRKARMAVGVALIILAFGSNTVGLQAPLEYPDKPAGLKKLIQDILKAEKDGNKQELKEYWDGLRLPNSDQWFGQVFGDRFGPPMAKTYTAESQIVGKTLDKTLTNALRDKMTQIDVLRFDKACDSQAGNGVYPLLVARKQEQAMYEVKLANGTYWTELFAFVYVDGSFRYIPQPRIPRLRTSVRSTNNAPSNDADGSGDSDDSGFTPAAITHQVAPIFPQGIGQSLTDSVRVNVLLGVDGGIKEMYPVAGQCAFVDAFQKAIRKWTFSPGKMNGTPYESWFLVSEDFTRSAR